MLARDLSSYVVNYGCNANVGIIPTEQIGVVALCSCDSKDADMRDLAFVLLHPRGIKNLNAKSEGQIHTTPDLS
jgi:hypothetical protein